ncbi:hypothetical protein BC629DRAFT_1288017 [Irpex lacteus]|nr:hypothetical protein BC629DRAFT_1288017 [Irpex lacteus]
MSIPSATDSVLAVTGSSVIDAPIDTVWRVLMDFPAYSEWCSNNPTPDQVAHEGSFLHLTVHLPPSMSPPSRFSLFSPSTTQLTVSVLDETNHRVAWTNRMPPWLLRTERWQWLTVVEEEDGSTKTKYESIEVFNGPAAYIVKFFVAPYLRIAFKAMGEDLKRRAEAQV